MIGSATGLQGLGETPWVDRNYKAQWLQLQRQVPPEWLPLLLDPAVAPRKHSVQEYGCGYYGCVSPTATPNIVVKITTDESEAWFAHVAMQLAADDDSWPPGIVRYHKVLKLPATHRSRSIYLLWRDEAWDVGYLRGMMFSRPRSYEEQQRATLALNLRQWDSWSQLLFVRITKSKNPLKLVTEAQQYDQRAWERVAEAFDTKGDAISLSTADPTPTRNQPAWDVARANRACGMIAQWMQNTAGSDSIGHALEYYHERGLVPADLHTGNIGMIMHPDYSELVPGIVDPGHVVPVNPDWYAVQIPEELTLVA